MTQMSAQTRTGGGHVGRIVVDTGGTFTDLVVSVGEGDAEFYKSPSTPDDPIEGISEVLRTAARARRQTVRALLGSADLFVHATTRAINAILTSTTAKTGLLVTKGHPDVLVFREGGRLEPFNYSQMFPDPYIPRALTREIPERVNSQGEALLPLDEEAAQGAIEDLRDRGVEAIAVCLLWSIVMADHELRVGELINQLAPGLPYTLSHQLNPTVREYRRASSAAIDASLKPVMARYLADLEKWLRSAGFDGRVLVVTSSGGVLDASVVAQAPIYALGSGPAMAPVAGRYYARREVKAETAVVVDAGGTSFDVSLVRRGNVPWTREAWLGAPFTGHMTGFPSVDVRSIGAGGGSIAWVDRGGLLHVGPESAGAAPGPACYGRGGDRPTVTDASLVLGYLDRSYFLGGRLPLDETAAKAAIEKYVAEPLGRDPYESAEAILTVTTEHMVRAIEEITLNQGIDPRKAVVVAGGGAAGLNIIPIARRLGCHAVVIPPAAPVLSAAGGLLSELVAEYRATFLTSSDRFDSPGATAVLRDLARQCEAFAQTFGQTSLDTSIEYFAEARYPHQIWELDVPLPVAQFRNDEDVAALRTAFHDRHADVFAIDDRESAIEVVGLRARVTCRLPGQRRLEITSDRSLSPSVLAKSRRAYFSEAGGHIDVPVYLLDSLAVGARVRGPALIESAMTTLVLTSDAHAEATAMGSLVISAAEPEQTHEDRIVGRSLSEGVG